MRFVSDGQWSQFKPSSAPQPDTCMFRSCRERDRLRRDKGLGVEEDCVAAGRTVWQPLPQSWDFTGYCAMRAGSQMGNRCGVKDFKVRGKLFPGRGYIFCSTGVRASLLHAI